VPLQKVTANTIQFFDVEREKFAFLQVLLSTVCVWAKTVKVLTEGVAEPWDLRDIHPGDHLKHELFRYETTHVCPERFRLLRELRRHNARDLFPVKKNLIEPY
jgi:hypothetical protein